MPPLLLNGAPFDVYTHAPSGAREYLLISQPTAQLGAGSAGCAAWDCTLLLNVYTCFAQNDTVTELPAYDLSSQVLTRLVNQRLPLPAPLTMSPIDLTLATTTKDFDDQYVYVMRHLRLRFFLYQ